MIASHTILTYLTYFKRKNKRHIENQLYICNTNWGQEILMRVLILNSLPESIRVIESI